MYILYLTLITIMSTSESSDILRRRANANAAAASYWWRRILDGSEDRTYPLLNGCRVGYCP